MPLLHPIELLLTDPARNAGSIVSWCARTTGAVPATSARVAAQEALHAAQLVEPTLRALAASGLPVPGLAPLVYEIEHAAAPHVEHWHRERAASATDAPSD